MKALILLNLLLLMGCTPSPAQSNALRETAEAYCTSQNGEVIDGRLFGQTQDYCLFADRSSCEIFDFQRGVCQQGTTPFPF